MEDNGRESDHLMLITPERVFYAGCSAVPASAPPAAATSMSR